MKNFEIHGRLGTCSIHVGKRFEEVDSLLSGRRAIIVTDTNVEKLHAARFPHVPVIAIGMGEGVKTLDTAGYLYRRLTELGCDRSTMLLGVGGGIVCDVTGFVAATFLRGLPFAFAPTTLLAQVDAAIGGKNGVNLDGYKNLVGTIQQPEFVLCDPAFLDTLPAEELKNGFAEIIKAGAVADASLFVQLADHHEEIQRRDANLLNEVTAAAVQVKVSIVNRDETELGERRLLNFGHTLGHALEKVFGISHGSAVAIGMAFAADVSASKGLLPAEDSRRLKSVVANYKLPTQIPMGSKDKLLDAMQKDKKRAGEHIHMILLKSLGQAVDVQVKVSELGRLLP